MSLSAGERRPGHRGWPKSEFVGGQSAFVDVAAMTERDHSDNEDVVVNHVKDAVVPYANSQAGTPLEGFGTWRPWILPEERDRSTDPVAMLMVNSFQRANCGRSQFDFVGHAQPRSAFT